MVCTRQHHACSTPRSFSCTTTATRSATWLRVVSLRWLPAQRSAVANDPLARVGVLASQAERARHRDLRSVHHDPIPSVRFGRDWLRHGRPRWGTPRTRRVTELGSEAGRVGSATLKRSAGCKPLLWLGFQRFADVRRKCGFLCPAASESHTLRTTCYKIID